MIPSQTTQKTQKTQTPRAFAAPWALVTGASEGIGQAFAQQLAARGYHVALVARRLERLEELAQALRAQHMIQTRVIRADLAQRDALRGLLDAVADLPVTMLVASAGFGTSGLFTEGSLADELEMMDVNCRAPLILCHELGQRFARQGYGDIILFGSIVGFQGVPRAAHYAATKAYIQTLAEGLRVELKPRGVNVVSCAPGPVQSGFATRAKMRMGATVTPQVVAAQTLQGLRRWGTIRPGLLSKVLELSLSTAPRPLRVHIMARIMSDMTRQQHDAPRLTTTHASATGERDWPGA